MEELIQTHHLPRNEMTGDEEVKKTVGQISSALLPRCREQKKKKVPIYIYIYIYVLGGSNEL